MAHATQLGHSPACLDRTVLQFRSARPGQPSHCPRKRALQHRPQAHQDHDTSGSDTLQQLTDRCRAAITTLPLAVRGVTAAAVVSAALLTAVPSLASDTAKVGTCLLGNCQLQLARCLGDGECLESLVCLNLCNNRKDEQGCQIRCGDLYSDKAISTFNECAVSNKKCVPQRIDEDVYPVPKTEVLDHNFDLSKFEGRWYITAGQNPLFDVFDCQEHYFGVPEEGQLLGKINWRIPKGRSDFIDRSTVQKFKQQADPAILSNRGNEYLHYEDDWYIVASVPDVYQFIYYKGNNDAWRGYGGAVVYTRSPTLPEQYVPDFKRQAESVGLKWEDFKITDNTCAPHPPKRGVAKAEQYAEDELRAVELYVQDDLTSFGKGFTVIEKGLLAELRKDETSVEGTITADLRKAEQFLEGVEAKYRLPKWMPFKDFLFKDFRFPWDKAPQAPQLPQIPGLPSQI